MKKTCSFLSLLSIFHIFPFSVPLLRSTILSYVLVDTGVSALQVLRTIPNVAPISATVLRSGAWNGLLRTKSRDAQTTLKSPGSSRCSSMIVTR